MVPRPRGRRSSTSSSRRPATEIEVIKVIREHTSLGLKETKDLVERTPTAVLENVNKEMVERFTAALVAAGACVTIK